MAALLTSTRLERLETSLSDRLSSPAATTLEQLVERNWITRYQAVQLQRGDPSSLRLGRYVLLDELGRGGMGVVYRARHTIMERVVALKVLPKSVADDPQAVMRFQREVVAAAKLVHPNIVTAYDAERTDEAFFLVMEYVKGDDLGDVIRAQGTLSVERAIAYTLAAATGLAFAHSRGVVHRDVKPGNLLLSSEGQVKILDMGLARLEETDAAVETRSRLTGDDSILGTVDFMSPEQALQSKVADARSDVYSLGMTLHWFLIGQPAYGGSSVMARLLAHREQPVPSLRARRPEVPAELDAIFQKMCAKRPEDRFQSMSEVMEALSRLQPSDGGKFSANVSNSTQAPGGLTTRNPGKPGADQVSPVNVPEPPATNQSKSKTHRQKLVTESTQRRPIQRRPRVWGSAAIVAGLLLALGSWGLWTWYAQSKELDAKREQSRIPAVTFNGGRGALPDNRARVVEVDQGASAAVAGSLDAKSVTNPVPTATAAPISETPPNLSLLFNGAGDHVRLPFGADGTNPLTIEAWVIPLVRREYGTTIISNTEDAGFKLEWVRPSDKKAVAERDRYCFTTYDRDVVEKVYIPADRTVEPGRRVHIAGVWQQQMARLYIDGQVQQGSKLVRNHVSSLKRFLISGNPTFFEGEPRAVSDFGFPGIIDEIRISEAALYDDDFTPSERLSAGKNTLGLYHCDEQDSNRLIDASSNQNHGEIVGAHYVSDAQVADLATRARRGPVPLRERLESDPGYLEFSGTTSVAAKLTVNPAKPLTIEAWVQPLGDAAEHVGTPLVIVNGFARFSTRFEAPLRWNLVCETDRSSNRYFTADGGGDVRIGHIVHVAGVYDGEWLGVYEDGWRVASRRTGPNWNPRAEIVTDDVIIGGWGPTSGKFRGRLYSLRISDSARYRDLFVEPPEHLVRDEHTLLLYECNERSGVRLEDTSGHGRHADISMPVWPPQ